MSVLRREGGAVYAEFLLAFVPLFVLCLGGVQVVMLAAARIVVQHAASMATRAAVLVIDDDPFFDRLEGTRRAYLADDLSGSRVSLTSSLGPLVRPRSSGSKKARGCDRLTRVRRAAYVPLSVLAPDPWNEANRLVGAEQTSVEGTLAHPLLRVGFGLGVYNRLASAITFPVAPGSDDLRSLRSDAQPFASGDIVTVRVTYLFACRVPIARELVCDDYVSIRDGAGELAHAEWYEPRALALATALDRFAILTAEASLPHQAAPYQYASELCKTTRKLAHCRQGAP